MVEILVSFSCLSIIDLTSNKQEKFDLPSLLLMSTLTPILMRPRISSSVIVIFMLAGFENPHSRLSFGPCLGSLAQWFHGFFPHNTRGKRGVETLFQVRRLLSQQSTSRWWSRRRPDLHCNCCCCRLLDEGNQSWPFLRTSTAKNSNEPATSNGRTDKITNLCRTCPQNLRHFYWISITISLNNKWNWAFQAHY